MEKEVLISDLSVCKPGSALANRYLAGKWKRLPYEADKFRGVMLYAMGPTPPAPLRLPLRVRGWHSIYVALYRTYNPTGLRLRLSSDRAYRQFVVTGMDLSKLCAFVDELYWKDADLTGESIHLAPLKIVDQVATDHAVAYIRLVPLSKSKVRALKRKRARTDTKRLLAKVDGHDVLFYGATTKAQLAEDVDVYKDSDFRGVMWELIHGDEPLFPAPGFKPRSLPQDTVFMQPGFENFCRTIARWRKEGFDPLRALRELTRSAGLELHVMQRMGAFSQPPLEHSYPNPFLGGKHTADYCRHADGGLAARFSYAKRHVQDRMLRIHAAAARYGIDGVVLMTIRGGPFVMYEPEMIERFRRMFGRRIDPRKLPLDDDRVWRVRADIFGDYLRRLRETLNDSARNAGHTPPQIGIYGLGTREACRVFGLDLKTWARQGLVDRIIASTWGQEHGGRELGWRNIDMKYYQDCVKGTDVELVAEIQRPKAGAELAGYYRDWAGKYYKQGIERLTFWDTNFYQKNAEQFAIMSALGHKDDLQRQTRLASQRCRQVMLKKLIGIELAKHRFPPWSCG